MMAMVEEEFAQRRWRWKEGKGGVGESGELRPGGRLVPTLGPRRVRVACSAESKVSRQTLDLLPGVSDLCREPPPVPLPRSVEPSLLTDQAPTAATITVAMVAAPRRFHIAIKLPT
ncbi:hypothetical protein COCNU_05G010350 [Cocos nucifera]|uniref:Uncharacterized protein n=1 Tax=Cocos nucifera TaxID=13894 RepID=A0A8K0N2J1_COCNU|nr:hypothetical protein COCNU_05G010350 [Cocos nucifera]